MFLIEPLKVREVVMLLLLTNECENVPVGGNGGAILKTSLPTSLVLPPYTEFTTTTSEE